MSRELERYYAARALEYDRVYQKPERQADLRAIEAWLSEALREKDVLEVACGTGYWTQFLAKSAASTVAFDASPEVLDIARLRVGVSEVSFTTGDAYRPPGKPGEFNAAFAGFWLSHVPIEKLDAFFDGLHRVLASGAIVILLDNRFVECSSTAISEVDDRGNTYQVRKLDDGSAHRILKNFPSEEALRQRVAKAASQIDYYRWPYFWMLMYRLGN